MTEPTHPDPNPPKLTEERIDFAYTVFWTKMVRQWTPERRAEMLTRLETLLKSPEFVNNAFSRKFEVAGLEDASLGETAHSGASLLALRKVLEAFQ